MHLLDAWGLTAPSVAANDIGGAIVLRALLLEGARYSDLTLFDCVSGGSWERGLFAQIRRHPRCSPHCRPMPTKPWSPAISATARMPGTARASSTYLRPWLGPEGQAAFYRQYRQLSEADTVDYEPHLAAVDVPVRLLWGREDRILPTPHGEWLRDHIPHESMHWIENAGHLLQEDSPAQLLSSIRG